MLPRSRGAIGRVRGTPGALSTAGRPRWTDGLNPRDGKGVKLTSTKARVCSSPSTDQPPDHLAARMYTLVASTVPAQNSRTSSGTYRRNISPSTPSLTASAHLLPWPSLISPSSNMATCSTRVQIRIFPPPVPMSTTSAAMPRRFEGTVLERSAKVRWAMSGSAFSGGPATASSR
jgi:hypothetical protein